MEGLLAEMRRRHPDAIIELLRVTHPTGYDNLWFLRDGDQELHFDYHPGGLPPFLIEGRDRERACAGTVDQAPLPSLGCSCSGTYSLFGWWP